MPCSICAHCAECSLSPEDSSILQATLITRKTKTTTPKHIVSKLARWPITGSQWDCLINHMKSKQLLVTCHSFSTPQGFWQKAGLHYSLSQGHID